MIGYFEFVAVTYKQFLIICTLNKSEIPFLFLSSVKIQFFKEGCCKMIITTIYCLNIIDAKHEIGEKLFVPHILPFTCLTLFKSNRNKTTLSLLFILSN